MSQIDIKTFVDVPAGPLSDQDKALHELGIMKTIYVPVHPFVEDVKIALGRSVEQVVEMFRDPHQRTQDNMHDPFFDTYIDWSRDAVDIQTEDFPHRYPTSGSNEAIRESIACHASAERAAGRAPRIHVFAGEYEGYTAHASSHEAEVIVHDRDDYQQSLLDSLKAREPFYLSAPSGIDGNIWEGYEDFLSFLETHIPESRLMLDLAYLNTTVKTPEIRTDSAIIRSIFVSMSKSFPGTYYDRIGGMLSKDEIPGLYGNMWFKNNNSLLLGTNLMSNSPLGKIPASMAPIQTEAVARLKGVLGEDLVASDVTFVATQPVPEKPNEIQEMLTRNGRIRYCLTPSIINGLYA